MKSTLVMLATVAVVAISMASAVLLFGDHRLYLICAGVVGGVTLAYAGWRWKRGAKGPRVEKRPGERAAQP
jgi:hypothetical protein